MKLTHCQTIVTPRPTEKKKTIYNQSKVTAICYSPDNDRLAVATADRVISLYNNKGERVDKFNTKANSNGPKDYIIRSIKFGPDVDHPKLAIAQSDAIVFIYKWKHNEGSNVNENDYNGDDQMDYSSNHKWDGKKSICNKFIEESAVTSLIWSKKHPFQVVYGLLEGRVKIGNLRTNKSKTIFKIDSNAVVSLTMNLDNTELLSGHTDGSIYRFVFPSKSKSPTCVKIIDSATIPYALSWGKSICVGGLNNRIVFYNDDGMEDQSFSYNDQEGIIDTAVDDFVSSEFTTSECSPSGDSIVIGSFNSFYLFCWNAKTKSWEEKSINVVKNMYSITAISWKSDGSSLALGTSSGLIDQYDAAFRRFIYRDTFLVTYVSSCQILVRDKDQANSSPVLIQSSMGEIIKLKIYNDPGTSMYRYLVARTEKSLIFCDMDSPRSSTSEIMWPHDEKVKEKFIFDAANACIISNAGELSIVEVSNIFMGNKLFMNFCKSNISSF